MVVSGLVETVEMSAAGVVVVDDSELIGRDVVILYNFWIVNLKY